MSNFSTTGSSNSSNAEKVQTFSFGRMSKIRKRITGKILKQSAWQWYNPPENSNTVNFCQNTTLHGLHYVGQQNFHLCERIFWLLAFLAAGFSATFFIWRLYTEYLNMPIVTVFNPTETSLDKIPFPAVTICNVNNIRKSKYNEYNKRVTKKRLESGISSSWNQTEYFAMLAAVNDVIHICESKKTFSERFTENIPRVERVDEVYTEIEKHKDYVQKLMNPKSTLQKGSQTCEEMLMFCLWQDVVTKCSKLFQEIETDFGSCCVFNMFPVKLLMKATNDTRDDPLRVKEWNKTSVNYDNLMFEKGYEERSFPYRQLYPGRSSGLSFLLDPDLDDYDCTNTDSEGYMISLNEPLTFPKMKDNGIAVPTGSEVFISVRPEVTMFDESIKQFTLDKRQCYFGDEQVLPHYTKYTAANCMTECIANRTLSKCHCKQHYMPRDGNNTLCTPDDYNCTEEVRQEIKKRGLNKSCKCLPTCTEIEYHTEATSLKIRSTAVSNLMENYGNIRKFDTTRNTSLSIVHVYFGVDAVYPRLRKEMMTKIDLLSNAGGLLGLCMGFSVLSVLEIVYYLTIRPLFRYYREKWNQQLMITQISISPNSELKIEENLSENEPSTSSRSASHQGNEIWATRVIQSSYAARFKSKASSKSIMVPVDVGIFNVVGKRIMEERKEKRVSQVLWQKR